MESSQAFIYSADSESSVPEVENIKPKSRRGKELIWVMSETFANLKSAMSAVRAEENWWKRVENKSWEGIKHIYDCKFSRKCPAKLMLHLHDTSKAVTLHRTPDTHNHDDSLHSRKNGIPNDVKNIITDLFGTGVRKPN